MTARDFCYWLQGFFEVGEPPALSAKQTELIKRHLALVFIHEIDPQAGGPDVQKVLQDIHDAASADLNNPPPAHVIGGEGPGGIKYRC